jgi:eukaryotic-like serine/threonine-protein kinase
MDQPERFGKYVVTSVLGEGAMGAVYKAFDPDIKREVAIKTIRGDLLRDSSKGAAMAARFRNEAQAAGRLTHPGIVAVYEYGRAGDDAYIAMEFVEGHTLRDYFARRAIFE